MPKHRVANIDELLGAPPKPKQPPEQLIITAPSKTRFETVTTTTPPSRKLKLAELPFTAPSQKPRLPDLSTLPGRKSTALPS